jgi:carboxyl-terminal processing protease
MKMKRELESARHSMTLARIIFQWQPSLLACLMLIPSGPQPASGAGPATTTAGQDQALKVTAADCRRALDKVDELVKTRFYNKALATTEWPKYIAAHRSEILASKDLIELSERMNAAIKVLKSSHCEFVTINDETYYFLRSIFSVLGKKDKAPAIDFVGAITGGVNCGHDKVRFVLDGSPAQKAGIQIGDQIVSVEGKPFLGQVSFSNTAGREIRLSFKRKGRIRAVAIKPVLRDDYGEFVAAIKNSARTFNVPGATLGYVHLWSGGPLAHQALFEVLDGKVGYTDGLILDLRGGYGANSTADLDFFYRQPSNYPAMVSIDRQGGRHNAKEYYDKPVVALIDGGARSGKEILAYSLKKSGRAKLVGERTAGACVAGTIIAIDRRMALYLAVFDVEVGGVRLEGIGVAPDEEVVSGCSQEGWDRQLAVATKLLVEQLKRN